MAKVNDELYEYTITEQNGRFYFRIGTRQWILANVQIEGTHVQFTIDGQPIELQVKNEQALLLETLGIKAELEQSAGDIKAPMPGKVLSIDVSEGDQVLKGDTLLVLEAMKMEHQIIAPNAGRIEQILYQEGDRVDMGSVLISISE